MPEQEWQHDNRRKQVPDGPRQREIAGRYAPVIAPLLRIAISEVIGELMVSKADESAIRAALGPEAEVGRARRPPKQSKPKPVASIDYSRWDDLDVSDDDGGQEDAEPDEGFVHIKIDDSE